MEVKELVKTRDLLTIIRDIESLIKDLRKAEGLEEDKMSSFIEYLGSTKTNLISQLDSCRLRIEQYLLDIKGKCTHDHVIEIVTGDRTLFKCSHCGYITDILPDNAHIISIEDRL